MRGRVTCLSLFLLAATVTGGRAAESVPVPTQAEWAAAKQTIALRNGIQMAYVDMGDPAAPPVILVHGYTDNSRSWSLVAPHLKGRRLIAIDLRGHGKSSAPACCYALTDFADDLAAFMEAKGIARADLIGHSLGSLTAQVFAAQHPDRVGRLVLVSSALTAPAGPGSWLWDHVTVLKAPIDPESQFMKDWYWNPNPVPADFVDRERTESAATPLQVWNGVLWGLATADLSAIAPLVKAPTLILWGEQDQLFLLADQEKLEKAYPEARFEIFRDAGHNMFWEFPEKAASIIGDFLSEADAPAESPLPELPAQDAPAGDKPAAPAGEAAQP